MSAPRPMLVILVGPVGSGKSHLAQRLAAELGCTVVANDEVRAELFAAPAFGDDENGVVYAAALDRVERALVAGEDVVYDGANLRADVRECVRRGAEPLADVLVVMTCASDAVCRDRLAGRPGGAEHWWAVYQELCAQMQPVAWSFVLADSTAPDDALLPLMRRLMSRPA